MKIKCEEGFIWEVVGHIKKHFLQDEFIIECGDLMATRVVTEKELDEDYEVSE